MKEDIYNLTWGNSKEENMYIKSNCTPEFMKKAIDEKNIRKCNKICKGEINYEIRRFR